MSNKTTAEHYCEHCEVEYTVSWNSKKYPDDPIFCPYCATGIDVELEMGEDNK